MSTALIGGTGGFRAEKNTAAPGGDIHKLFEPKWNQLLGIGSVRRRCSSAAPGSGLFNEVAERNDALELRFKKDT